MSSVLNPYSPTAPPQRRGIRGGDENLRPLVNMGSQSARMVRRRDSEVSDLADLPSLDDLPLPFGPAHAYATLAPRGKRSAGTPMSMTITSETPISALSARAESNASFRSNRASSLIDRGRMLEEQARSRLARARARLQRDERKRNSRRAVDMARLQKQEQAEQTKAELELLHGKDLLDKLQTIPKATYQEVLSFAEIFNEHLHDNFGLVGPASVNRLWKKMLVPMGPSGTGEANWGTPPPREGSINFADFERVVAEELHLDMPQEKLMSLWRALDADGNGTVEQGEFIRFMRFGSADTDARLGEAGDLLRQAQPPALDLGSSAPSPRRSKLSEKGDSPVARKKERQRMRQMMEAQKEEARFAAKTFVQQQRTSRELEKEAERLEKLLEASQHGGGDYLRGGNSKLPGIGSPIIRTNPSKMPSVVTVN